MSKSQSVKHILAQAKEKEKKHDWLGAIEFHKKASDQVLKQEDFLKAGEAEERIGYCFHRAAFQAESQEDFANRMTKAIEAYYEALELYEEVDGEQKAGRRLRCRALTKFSSHWLKSSPSEKKESLEECWRLTRAALNAFEGSGEHLEYCDTYHKLSSTACKSFQFQGDSQTSEKILREAIDSGERAITLLSHGDALPQISLAKAYAKTAAYLAVILHYFSPDVEEYERYYRKARSYWEKAYALAADAALLELLTLTHDFDHLFSFSELFVIYKEALDYARTTRDKCLIGTALDMLAYTTYWTKSEFDDPNERLKQAQSALHYSKAAREQFASISIISPHSGGPLWPEAPYCEYNLELAQYETDLERKRDLLKEALRDGAYALELAESTGMPHIVGGLHHQQSKVLESLARIAQKREKREFLEKALEHREESIRFTEQLYSSNHWNNGVGLNYLANIKAELADLETNPQNKMDLLAEAVSDKEHGLQLCRRTVQLIQNTGDMRGYDPWLGHYQYSHGELLNRLYRLTDNDALEKRTIQAFKEAAETFLKSDLFSRAAECYWKVGLFYDDLRKHLEAAKNFTLASTYYTHAIKRIPQLEDFYRTHVSYMDAWSEIEQAKHHHSVKLHEQAQKHYTRAATLHQSTESWSYLSPNYSAWARLEEAEHLSRSERTEEAKNRFQDAAQLFLDAKQSIEAKINSIEDVIERELAHNLVRASIVRHRYCLGRMALEEARLLDRRGGHRESSIKFGLAASTFQDVANALENERDRQEIMPIIELSKAWQLMTQAEAEVSSDLYAQASQCFERVKANTTDERASQLAVGHSLFCQALEAGTRFEATRDQESFAKAKKYLVAAENYYVKAGFHTASDYARATHRLLDAYWHIYKAETELEHDRKSQYYQLSAKLLQAAVDAYSRARHHEKTEQVQRLLERVLEERKLTMALSDILHTPRITLSTESFVTPSQTYEQAVGSERFDHAHIQGKLTIPTYGAVGEAIDCKLDLVNVGKTLGLLIRIDDLLPQDWTVLATPSHYAIEDGSLNLKGRALGSLKSESITLRVQARKPGSFTVTPHVIYVDEVGKFRTSKVEPVVLTVHPKLAFEFKTKASKNTFDYLIHSFVEDYMRRRISLEKSGWRTLMEIVKHGKVSKSSVYGARGRRGRAISELERRGLVEERIFLGERGRGGKVVKLRICYDKETIKRHVDQGIMKIREK